MVCIVQIFDVDYEMIAVNTSKFINTYHNIQYIDTIFLYIPILVHAYKYMQYITMHINTS